MKKYFKHNMKRWLVGRIELYFSLIRRLFRSRPVWSQD